MSRFLLNWFNWISLLFSFLLYYLGLLEGTDDIFPLNLLKEGNEVKTWIIQNKVYLVLILLISIGVLQYFSLRKEQNLQRNWIIQFLEHITNQHLSGGAYNTRITIFRIRRGWHFIFPHLWRWLRISDKKQPFSLIPNPTKKYLSIYVRYCSVSTRKKSFTFFRLHESTNNEPQSLVAECFKKCESIKCMTGDISDVDISNYTDQSIPKHPDWIRINEYMNICPLPISGI